MKKGRSKMNQRGGGDGGALVAVLVVGYLLSLAVKGMRTQRIIDIFG